MDESEVRRSLPELRNQLLRQRGTVNRRNARRDPGLRRRGWLSAVELQLPELSLRAGTLRARGRTNPGGRQR